MKEIKEKLKKESEEIKEGIREQTYGYILAALGFVAALAWNEAIRDFLEYLFPLEKNTLLAKFIYAIGITIVVVIFSIYFTKIFKKKNEKEN